MFDVPCFFPSLVKSHILAFQKNLSKHFPWKIWWQKIKTTISKLSIICFSRFTKEKSIIVIFVKIPSSLNIFYKTILISLMRAKKDGNVHNVKLNSKLKVRWINTLKRFMKESGTIYVSYVEKHLYANLTWTPICEGFMREQSAINVQLVRKATKRNKHWKATLRRFMREISKRLNVICAIRTLRALILSNDTLKLFMRRKSRSAATFVRHALDKSLI